MAISTIPAATSNTVPLWTSIASASPSGVATYTFSSLSGYRKYRLVSVNMTNSVSAFWNIHINGDTSGLYNNSTIYSASGTLSMGGATAASSHSLNGNSAQITSVGFQVDIEGFAGAGKSIVSTTTSATGSLGSNSNGFYLGTSAVTSIDLTVSTGTFTAGTIYLLGAN